MSAGLSSRERFLAALRGEKPDRTPVAHVSAMTNRELQERTGCRMPEAHHDPEQLVRLCGANHDILGFDAVTFIINYFNEPAALGCRMRWGGPEELPACASHPWRTEEDAVHPRDLLDREPLRTILRALRLAKKRYGQRAAVLGKVMGPLSMVQVMHGVEATMIGLVESPGRIRHFLDTAVEILADSGCAMFEQGIDALAIGEGGAGANMLSPPMHEAFLTEAHRRLVSRLPGPTIMHICGDITPRLDMLGRSGITCFSFDWAIPPRLMKEKSAGRFRIMGNINTADLLRAAPQEIERQVVENLEAGTDIVGPGCAVSPRCPTRNLRALADAVERRRAGDVRAGRSGPPAGP
jgi:[methyl-Co(III) methanol-specific corrinoid protein]:coenzyme M methyltransferase